MLCKEKNSSVVAKVKRRCSEGEVENCLENVRNVFLWRVV